MISKSNKRRRLRRHGFLARMRAGGHIIKSRRSKRRHQLSV